MNTKHADLWDEVIGRWCVIEREPSEAERKYLMYDTKCTFCRDFKRCKECPIRIITGEEQCHNTIYYDTDPSEPESIAAFIKELKEIRKEWEGMNVK